MKRDSSMSVEKLWQEWSVGIDGKPAIRHLETSTRKKWRSGDKTENKYFERRKVIIDAVQGLIDTGLTANMAVAALEEQRGTKSLNQFYKELKQPTVGADAGGATSTEEQQDVE